MAMIQKIFLFILMLITLTGCKKEITYAYLMQHPLELKQALIRCQTNVIKNSEQTRQCEVVSFAADNIFSLLTHQQENPEKFGQEIMEAEMACVKASEELTLAQQALAHLQEQSNSGSENLTAAQKKVTQIKKMVDAKNEEIKVMQAILSLSGPE